jgi:CSLREA domain-containing protein
LTLIFATEAAMLRKMRSRTLLSLGLAVVCGGALPSVASGATITVNATADGLENGGVCTLREAVSTANDNLAGVGLGCNGDTAGLDTILLQGGQTYVLTRHALPDDTNVNGDLDVTGGGGTIIRSAGPGLATIDADSNVVPGPPADQRGRAIEVLSSAGAVALEGIRVQGGGEFSGAGGGILSVAPLTLIDSEVTNNVIGEHIGGLTTSGGAGILINDPGSLTLTRSTVANNVAKANPSSLGDSARGGGILFGSPSGDLNATNSTISGNVVDSSGNTVNTTYGGGIWYSSGLAMNLTNVTISNNSATGGGGNVFGGGIVLFNENATLTNVILAANNAPTHLDCHQVGVDDDWISGGNNVIGDTSGCGHTTAAGDVFFANPSLGTLSNYGGNTRTMLPNPGSPAINRGGTCPTTDQRGLFRYISLPCDTGSVEVNATATPPPTSTGPTPSAPPKCKKTKKRKSAAAAKKKCKKKKKKHGKKKRCKKKKKRR